ncbi:MAG: aldo/keto reductase [Opitutaceae bacterium]|nr:aldo/keto reductase [Opitutaceae bacterium]
MKYRKLGRTNLKISLMGMGTGGGPDPLGQASGRPEAEAIALLRRAYDLGINFFDTAPGYLDSEVILGRALRELPREDVVVSTKIALAGGMPGQQMTVMRADEIEDAVNTSLRRLGMDYVDLMLIGVAGPEHKARVMDEQLPVLERLKEAGKIRFIGSSELSRSDGAHTWLQAMLPEDRLDVMMVAHNMINQSAQRTVFPACREKDVGVINIFTVRKVFGTPGRLQEVLDDLVARGLVDAEAVAGDDPLGWIVESGAATSVIEAAYRYAAYTDGVTAVMNGANDIALLEQNVASVLKGPLPDAARERLGRVFGRVEEAIGN